MANDSQTEQHGKTANDNFAQKTWFLLLVTWALCLIPIPLTGTIALVMNFAAFVMAIVVLAKGYVRYGVLQLLSVFILTPIFYLLGVIISATLISQTLDTNNLSKQAFKDEFFESLNNEIEDIYNITGRDSKSTSSVEAPIENTKPGMSPSKNQQNTQEKEKVITWYIAYTKEGGEIKCSEIVKSNNLLILRTKSGMEIDIDQANILKVERYKRVAGKTLRSIWDPTKG